MDLGNEFLGVSIGTTNGALRTLMDLGNEFLGVSIGTTNGALRTLVDVLCFGPFEIAIGSDWDFAFFSFGVRRRRQDEPRYMIDVIVEWVPQTIIPIEDWP